MRTLIVAGLIILSAAATSAAAVTEGQVRAAITHIEQLKAMGPQVLPHLARIYSKSTEDERSAIASMLYGLGWKSPEARAVLLKDVGTSNQSLRLNVQWALGRVSDDTEVVDILANIMRNDGNALFRDKAACALAYDQIHLTERQKVRLYGQLIEGLSDPKEQVRAISIQALQIHTGQDKGFRAGGEPATRENAVARWKLWLRTYEENL